MKLTNTMQIKKMKMSESSVSVHDDRSQSVDCFVLADFLNAAHSVLVGHLVVIADVFREAQHVLLEAADKVLATHSLGLSC